MDSENELRKQLAQLTETVLILSKTIENLSSLIADDSDDEPESGAPVYLNSRN